MRRLGFVHASIAVWELGVIAGGCAGGSTSIAPAVSTPPPASPTTPRASLPVASDRVFDRRVASDEWSSTPRRGRRARRGAASGVASGPTAVPETEWLVRDDGRIVAMSPGIVEVLDANDEVTRRVHGGLVGHSLAAWLDAEGRHVLTEHSIVDLDDGTISSPPDERLIAGCTHRAQMCVFYRAVRGDDGRVVVELELGAPTSTVRRPSIALDPERLLERANLAPNGRNDFEPGSVHVEAVVDGDASAVDVFTPLGHVLCALDFAARTVLACREAFESVPTESGEVDEVVSLAHIDRTASTVLVRSDRHYALLDAQTLARVALRDALPASHTGDVGRFVLGSTEEGRRVLLSSSLAPIGEPIGADARVGFGSDGYVVIDGSSVSFHDDQGRSRGTSRLDDDDAQDAQIVAVRESEVVLWNGARGFARVAIGAQSSPFHGAHGRVAMSVHARDGGLVLEAGGTSLMLSRAGIGAERDGSTPEIGPPPSPIAERRRSLASARANARDDDRIAIAPDSIPEVAYAMVRGRDALAFDERGNPIGRATRIPAAVAASECLELDFVGDSSLALHGPAPCIPTRIDLRAGRTSPLGLAYVRVASTPDGSRVALLANHEVKVLDGRSGRTLAIAPAGIDHPRSIAITDDGRRVTVRGEGDGRLFDASNVAVGADAPRAPIDLGSIELPRTPVPGISFRLRGRGTAPPPIYIERRNLLVHCDQGAVTVETPFEPQSVRSAPTDLCTHLRVTPGGIRIPIASSTIVPVSDDVVALVRDEQVAVVRVRDLAVLRFDAFASPGALEIALFENDRLLGAAPDGTGLVGIAVDGDARYVDVPLSSDVVNTSIRAFFESLASSDLAAHEGR